MLDLPAIATQDIDARERPRGPGGPSGRKGGGEVVGRCHNGHIPAEDIDIGAKPLQFGPGESPELSLYQRLLGFIGSTDPSRVVLR